MDGLFMTIPAKRQVETNPANPVDPTWNVAVRHMANLTCPMGWKEYPTFAEAPTTLAQLIAHVAEHGTLGVATEDSDGTLFDCADTNAHLRAWHDSIHLRHRIDFTVAGEAAAVYLQAAQIYHVYGYNATSIKWVQLLLADILGLVLHHKQTGKYPKNKRAGTVNAAPRWKHVAELLGMACGPEHEAIALDMAKRTWGPYKGW